MAQPNGDKALESQLQRLIQACSEGLTETRGRHESTKTLYPFLAKLTQLTHFRSPNDRLVKDEIWQKIQVGSSSMTYAERMLEFDALADHLRDIHYNHLRATCVGVLGLILGFEVFAHWMEGETWILAIALLFLALAFVIVFVMRSRTVQMAYLSARTIAEVLRIQFFMNAAGVPFPAHEKVPRRYETIFGRILAIVENIHNEAAKLPKSKLEDGDIDEAWFEGQKKYFKKAMKREHQAARRWELGSTVAFTMAILAMAGLAWVSKLGGFHSDLGRSLLVSGPSLLGIAGLCQFYMERRGFKSNAERYRYSIEIYNVKPEVLWEKKIEDVGSQALQEVIDWYVASMEREICVPRG